jgi:hypothetical protein
MEGQTAGRVRSGRTPSPWVTHPDHRNSLSVFWLTIPGGSSVLASVGCGSGFHSVTLFPTGFPGQRRVRSAPTVRCCGFCTERNNRCPRPPGECETGESAHFVRGREVSAARTISRQPLRRDCNIADHGVQGVRLVLPAVESRRFTCRSATRFGFAPKFVRFSGLRSWSSER